MDAHNSSCSCQSIPQSHQSLWQLNWSFKWATTCHVFHRSRQKGPKSWVSPRGWKTRSFSNSFRFKFTWLQFPPGFLAILVPSHFPPGTRCYSLQGERPAASEAFGAEPPGLALRRHSKVQYISLSIFFKLDYSRSLVVLYSAAFCCFVRFRKIYQNLYLGSFGYIYGI